MMAEGPLGGAAGNWTGNTDFINLGYDGCIKNTTDGACKCSVLTDCTPGAVDYGVLDYAIGGVDPTNPNIGRVAMVSVDFNEAYQAWLLDNAGAPVVDGNACLGDGNSGNPNLLVCTPIPIPAITGSSPAAGGANINLTLGPAPIPFPDDCLIAEDKATNCPRNLAPGRVVMYRHGTCPGALTPGERRTFTYPPQPSTGTLNIAPNFTIYSVEDGNLNGVLDAGEDGTNGGAVNSALDPFFIAGTLQATTTIRIPAVAGASDCIFLATGIGVDNNHFSVDPPTNTIFGEMVILPVVSVNPTPIRSGTGTPVADIVTTISTSKSQGKATVNWETGIESTTSGFNVIGTKKNGGETKLNGSIIVAKEGTTGKGATYSVTFDAGQLKGSSSVYVEIVKTDGSKERFGPASF